MGQRPMRPQRTRPEEEEEVDNIIIADGAAAAAAATTAAAPPPPTAAATATTATTVNHASTHIAMGSKPQGKTSRTHTKTQKKRATHTKLSLIHI